MIVANSPSPSKFGTYVIGPLGHARIVERLNGFGYIQAEVAMMDLAVRTTPSGCEGWALH